MNLQELQKCLADFGKLRDKKDRLESDLKEVNKKIEEEEPKLLDIMDKLNMQSMKMPKVGMFYVETKAYPQVKDNEKLVAWMKDNDRGSVVKEQVHYQTLVGVVNELLKENLETPPGVEVYMKRRIKLRRS